jgi:hypothetical protein
MKNFLMLIIATLVCVSAGAQSKKVYFDKATDTYKEVTLKSEKISEEDTIPYTLQIFADKTKPLTQSVRVDFINENDSTASDFTVKLKGSVFGDTFTVIDTVYSAKNASTDPRYVELNVGTANRYRFYNIEVKADTGIVVLKKVYFKVFEE